MHRSVCLLKGAHGYGSGNGRVLAHDVEVLKQITKPPLAPGRARPAAGAVVGEQIPEPHELDESVLLCHWYEPPEPLLGPLSFLPHPEGQPTPTHTVRLRPHHTTIGSRVECHAHPQNAPECSEISCHVAEDGRPHLRAVHRRTISGTGRDGCCRFGRREGEAGRGGARTGSSCRGGVILGQHVSVETDGRAGAGWLGSDGAGVLFDGDGLSPGFNHRVSAADGIGLCCR
mmetsp:Transcript_1639/g.3559  ORF Transcript_1639/g.3559 Transcript_1639/m.3559 type:complete len:230 (+) Transcript_1639:705-1394(+)